MTLIYKKAVLVIAIVLFLQPVFVSAQTSVYRQDNYIYKGFEASFGTRSFLMNSGIEQLNGLPILQEGGQIGVIYGNSVVRTSIGVAGFFYSGSCVPHTINLFESDLGLNFYPLNIGLNESRTIEPYLTGGVIYNRLKFFGHYLDKDKSVNYSSSIEPFLGTTHQMLASAGAGVEMTLREEYDFLQLFAEAKYGVPIVQGTKYDAFKDTSVTNQILISIGVRFGARR